MANREKMDTANNRVVQAQILAWLAQNQPQPLSCDNLDFNRANAQVMELMADKAGPLPAALRQIAQILAEIRSGAAYAIGDATLRALDSANQTSLEAAKTLADSNFYVGLLGEFSCGKSTFINALLEDEFLHGDPLQGTTCARTVVSYGQRERIRVIFDNDTYIDFANAENALLDPDYKREFVRLMTAEEHRARSIREVICEMPNPVLANGLAIIDTPGIGSLNLRHTEAARRAIQDCDAVLVLTSLDKPLSAELIAGVKGMVGGSAPNCIFIGTRKDQLPSRELPRQARFFAKKLHNSFGRDCHYEFVSAYTALQELAGESGARLKEFREFRSRVQSFLESNRTAMQIAKTRSLIQGLIHDLGQDIARQQEDFASRIAEYNAQAIPIDSALWRNWKKDIEERFHKAQKDIRKRCRAQAMELTEQISSAIKYKIRQCDDTSELKEYLSEGIGCTMESFSDEIENSTRRYIHEPMQKEMRNLLGDYGRKFHKEYARLSKILGTVAKSDLVISEGRDMKINVRAGSADYSELAANMDSEEDWKIGGGLATGIGLGMLVPGVGWLFSGALAIVGGFLGGVLGVGFLKSLETRKREAREKVDDSMGEFEARLISALDDACDDIFTQFDKAFGEALASQQGEYKKVIDSNNNYIMQTSQQLASAASFITAGVKMLEQIRESLVEKPHSFESQAQRAEKGGTTDGSI